jgi:hypothetical protein
MRGGARALAARRRAERTGRRELGQPGGVPPPAPPGGGGHPRLRTSPGADPRRARPSQQLRRRAAPGRAPRGGDRGARGTRTRPTFT